MAAFDAIPSRAVNRSCPLMFLTPADEIGDYPEQLSDCDPLLGRRAKGCISLVNLLRWLSPWVGRLRAARRSANEWYGEFFADQYLSDIDAVRF